MFKNPPEHSDLPPFVGVLTGVLLLGLPLFTPHAQAQGGIPLWTNRYHGVASGRNGASGIAVDNLGNVFVTGQSIGGTNFDFATMAYSSAGVPLWTNRYPAQESTFITPRIAADRDSNAFVTGPCPHPTNSNADDYVTVAYSGVGAPLWTNSFPAQGAQGNHSSIAVGGNGNVFICCPALNDRTNLEYAVIAYSNAGLELWTNRYHGSTLDNEYPRAIGVDGSGNVFVTGAGLYDSATIAYSNAGVPLWTNHFNGSLLNLTVHSGSGDVFVVGNPPPVGNNYLYATVAYSGSGEPLWTNIYAGPGNSYNIPEAVAVDQSGNVAVTGQATTSGWVYGTVAYSPAGLPLWTNLCSGPEESDLGLAITADPAGNFFVTGTSSGANGAAVIGTVAYSAVGLPLWTNRYQAVSNSLDGGQAIAADPAGNIYVAGVSMGTNGDQAFVTIKYSSSVQPYLTIEKLNTQAVLTWTNAGFILQSAPVIMGPFTNVPGAITPYTNSAASAQLYFRLTAP